MDNDAGMASSESLSPLIDRDPLAADFLVSIFWSAMTSFRHDTVLRPFPPAFVDEGHHAGPHKNVEKLVRPFERKNILQMFRNVGMACPKNGMITNVTTIPGAIPTSS